MVVYPAVIVFLKQRETLHWSRISRDAAMGNPNHLVHEPV